MFNVYDASNVKLAQGIAKILCVEDQFVATPEKSDISLKSLDLENTNICKESLIKSHLLALIFGVTDLNGDKMIVTKDRTIKFLESISLMPSSNSFVEKDGEFYPSFCSKLLNLRTRHSFNDKDLEIFKDEFKNYKHLIDEYLKTIPSSDITNALNERLEDFKNIIDEIDEVNSLRGVSVLSELIINSNKTLKFAAVLSCLSVINYHVDMIAGSDPLLGPRTKEEREAEDMKCQNVKSVINGKALFR